MKLFRLADRATAALVGAVVGALLVLSVDAMTRPTDEVRPPATRATAPEAITQGLPDPPARTAVLAWSPGGLPRGSERIVERARAVQAATTVVSGQDWIRRTRAADGTPVDDPPGDLRLPVEVAVVEPREYARFVPSGDRDLIESLRPGEVLLARTAAGLRRGDAGMEIELADHTVRVAGLVSDAAANGYEMLMARPVPRSWRVAYPFLLVEVRKQGSQAVKRRLESLLGEGERLRVRSGRETPFFRYGDAVLPQMMLKETFGEFAARPRADGFIDIDPAWVKRNIARASVPVLGSVVCHRALIPQLRGALRDLQASGLAYTVNARDYGGCFNPRFINADPEARLSHHSWGIALDINVSENAFATRPNIDPRLVETMTAWGFTWGGNWLRPDGMHFEWISFP
jgi:hypothetical protein